MPAYASRGIALSILLAALCWPASARAQAQAPVANNFLLNTMACLTQTIYFNHNNNTTWTNGLLSLKYSIVTPPSNGVINFPLGTTTYKCTYVCTNANYVGTDPFTWTAGTADGKLVSGVATCMVSVVGPAAPTATAFSVSVPIVVPEVGFTGYNFSQYVVIPAMDAGAPATYSFVTLPTNGTSSFSSGNNQPYLSYTPNAAFTGTDSFLWNVTVNAMSFMMPYLLRGGRVVMCRQFPGWRYSI